LKSALKLNRLSRESRFLSLFLLSLFHFIFRWFLFIILTATAKLNKLVLKLPNK
jgi:hypothetical protein